MQLLRPAPENGMMDDAALVRQVLAGHANAYTQLVQRWAGRALALCHARVGRADVAEELAQETLVRGFEQLTSLADPARFGPWLAGIATNTCRDWLKSRKNAQVPFSVLQEDGKEVPQPAVPASDEVERRDEASRVLREVEALPEEYRTVVMLFYYQQASYRDIAHLLDVSTATVNTRLTRARVLLRDRLAPPETRSAS